MITNSHQGPSRGSFSQDTRGCPLQLLKVKVKQYSVISCPALESDKWE